MIMKQFTGKKLLINQPYFLGDILFVMALIQKLVNDGHDVTFPVRDEYYNLQKNFPTVKMIPLSKFPQYEAYNKGEVLFQGIDYLTLSLRHSYLKGKGHMKIKYSCIGLDMEMWRDINIVRDLETEQKLFNELGLKSDEKYNLINEFHRPFFHNTPIVVEGEYRNIYMSQLEGYSLLDWIGVMENAQSIHTIATSLIFLMDSIDSMPEEMHLYRRYRGEEHNGGYWDHSDYDFLLNKNYIYH